MAADADCLARAALDRASNRAAKSDFSILIEELNMVVSSVKS
jgi:hypothetical protein